MLYPSSRSRRRSALRSICLCDIEDSAVVLNGHCSAGRQRPLMRLALCLVEGHREDDIWVRGMSRECDLDDCIERQDIGRDRLFRAVHNYPMSFWMGHGELLNQLLVMKRDASI